MRHCGEIILKEIKRQRVKQKDLSEYVGVTPQGLAKMLQRPSMETEILEKICQYLHLDPADFFDFRPFLSPEISVQGVTQNNSLSHGEIIFDGLKKNTCTNADTECSDLLAERQKLIDEKDRRIEALERTIAILLRNQSLNTKIASVIQPESTDE